MEKTKKQIKGRMFKCDTFGCKEEEGLDRKEEEEEGQTFLKADR